MKTDVFYVHDGSRLFGEGLCTRLDFFRLMMTISYDEMEFCYAFGVKRFIWGVCVCLLDAIYLYFRL